MPITVTCPGGHVLHVEDKYAGRSGKCPKCHSVVHVPRTESHPEYEILELARPAAEGPAPVPDATTQRSDRIPSDSPPMPRHPSTSVYHRLGVWRYGDRVVVRFGDHRILDESTVKKISEELFSVAEKPTCHHLIVNFTSVRGLTTLMLGKLLMLHKTMAAKGGKLILCEIGPEIEYAFVETKLTQIFEIRETESEALEACK